MLNYSNIINIIYSIKVDNNSNLRSIFDDALNYEFTESEIPLEFREGNIQRILVNSIRHSYSNYEKGLKKVYRLKSEKDYYRYKNATLERIAIGYPTLRDECERKKHKLCMVNIVSGEIH